MTIRFPVPARLWRAGTIALLALALLPLGALPGPALAAPAPPGWRDTGLVVPPTQGGDPCIDATQPGTLLVADTQGTTALNWATGRTARVSDRPFSACGAATGLLYAPDPPGSTGQGAYRFSLQAPQGQQIAFMPTYFAVDGSLQVYATRNPSPLGAPTELWASADGGLTWQQRRLPGSPVQSFAVSPADGRAVYASTQQLAGNTVSYTVYFSPDAGVTWEARAAGQISGTGFTSTGVAAVPGHNTPINTVLLRLNNGIPGSNSANTIYLSTDGARTFAEVGGESIVRRLTVVHTARGLVRLARGNSAVYTLARSADGGRTWQNLPLPFATTDNFAAQVGLQQALVAPDNLFLLDYANNALWYSPDAGGTWQALGSAPARLLYTPYVPLTLAGVRENNRLVVLDLPDAARSLTARTPATGAADALYFPPTGHTLSPLFAAYWQANGGLAQFGYPRTEAVREVNPTDGRAYVVQYFERNRFEYHPENAGSPYTVLLGLLGTQISEPLRAAGHGAFNRFPDMHYPRGRYFPQTGHNLRNSFRDYWEQHGGLAIYGYPISEEFEERSPTDGRTYVVQYFERNRFEWHPENRGTPYEVLLGLLGNTLLEQKGWLPAPGP
jgi:hypothetical protein